MQTYKILIVENDLDFSYILRKWVSQPLYELTTVNTAEEAEILIEEKQWDLIISDVNLPRKSGIDLLSNIKNQNLECPVILMTGNATLEMAVEAIDKHAQVFLLKPFSKKTILGKISEALHFKKTKAKRKVLAIGAHPDDVEIGCGGILLRHAKAGDEIHILTMSYGSKGGDSIIRYNEAKKSADALGAELHVANLPDTEIPEGALSIKKIEALVKHINPDVVYTHTLNDSHQDHRSVHRASLVACRDIERVECYQSPSSTTDFKPPRFVDVSDQLKEKLVLIDFYRSQKQKCEYLKESVIESNARYWGRFANYKLVEPLEVIRSV